MLSHVRLLFWWDLDEIKASYAKAHMSADIALDPDGSLDLLKVQALWGLESVKVLISGLSACNLIDKLPSRSLTR